MVIATIAMILIVRELVQIVHVILYPINGAQMGSGPMWITANIAAIRIGIVIILVKRKHVIRMQIKDALADCGLIQTLIVIIAP